MVIALPALAEILFWVGALIFCLLVVYIAKALFGVAGGTLGKLPVVGGWINGQLHSVEHKIVSVMSGAAASVDAQIGAAYHRLARLVDWVGREINSHANLLAMLGALLIGAAPAELVRLLNAEIRRLIHAVHAQSTAALRQAHAIPKQIARGIGEDVLPRIRTAEREIGRVIHRDLPAVRAREKALQGEVTQLGKWVRAHTLEAGTLAFAGAVALALHRLGLDWLRCNSARSVFRKRGCGMWDGLDKLLALVGEVLLVANICTVIPWLESAFSFVAAPLIETLTSVGAGLCDPGSAPPELLPKTHLALPANPGFTLYLP